MKKTEQEVIEGSKSKGVTYTRELIALIEMRKKLCDELEFRMEWLNGRSRKREIVRVRMAYVAACVSFCEKVKEVDIAALVGRDHATVNNYLKDDTGTHHLDMAQDEEYREIYERAREILAEVYFTKSQESDLAIDLGLDLMEKYQKAEKIATKIIDEIPNGLVKLENFYKQVHRRSKVHERQNRSTWKGALDVIKGL